MYNSTETLPMSVMDVERKTIPVVCPWCDKIFGVAKVEIEEGRKIGPAHKICKTCFAIVNQTNLPKDKTNI
ncbi:MAG TPA: hypothetical protein DCZ94_09830 [Lentisphaeria bacterium]|nr:MAG: hypothetical protein A2X48_19070 [Lentisphaerae bacterium GWF2_49_21]HBC87242.1 hypothetical protein [Lentisphaeria bacterium]